MVFLTLLFMFFQDLLVCLAIVAFILRRVYTYILELFDVRVRLARRFICPCLAKFSAYRKILTE